MLTVDPVRVVGGKEGSDAPDICGLTDAAEGGALHDGIEEFWDAEALIALGLDHARVEAVDADPARAELLGEGDGDGVDGALGGGIDGGHRASHGRDNGADVDDRTALGADELGGTLGGEEEAEDVEVELAVELFRGDTLDGAEGVDAGVVDQDVEFAVLLLDLGEGAGDVFGFGEVALQRRGFAAGGDDLGDDLVGA